MKKYILMMLASSFIGIFANPEILSASNSVTVNGIDNTNIVETVIPEPEPAYEVSYASYDYTYYEEPAYTYYEEPAVQLGYGAAEPEYLSFYVTSYNDTIVVNPSYSDIYQTGKLIYAHNSADLLYNLNYLYEGDVFMINGNMYRVAERKVYEKTDDYSLDGSRSVMKKLKNTAYGHTFALMTCSGRALGNGDATHRLVIFADAI